MSATELIAFLGPEGSYTDLALKEHLAPSESHACFSITEVIEKLTDGAASGGFVPIENAIQGPVSETLDLLFKHKGNIFIESSYSMNIVHCLGARTEDKSRITDIFSHDQALRQCSDYLFREFPKANQNRTSSTRAAADHIVERKLNGGAAIAARSTLESLNFKILDEDIANSSGNRTRFVLLRPGDFTSSSASRTAPQALSQNEVYITSIVVDPGRDRQGILYEVMRVISEEHNINLRSIHSRPDPRGVFVFHFDLEGHASENKIINCIAALNDYCLNSTGKTAEITIFGSYKQQKFHDFPFQKIGVVGGKGKMGLWFTDFFENAGLEVHCSDSATEPSKDNLSLQDLAKTSDVIVLSVPMSAIASVVAELKNHLRPGTLVVENCSIKGCSLPLLEKEIDEGVELLGLHTMFAGDVSQLNSENVIVTKNDRSGKKADAFEGLFYKYGAKITHASVEEHDTASSFLQALVQCSMVALADTMAKKFKTPEDITAFSTPNSRAVLSTMERVLRQSDELLVDMQNLNSENADTRRLFLESIFKLVLSLQSGEQEEFLRMANRGRRFFAQSDD